MSRAQIADYLATLTTEMAQLAKDADLPTLSYLCAMAGLEAKSIAAIVEEAVPIAPEMGANAGTRKHAYGPVRAR